MKTLVIYASQTGFTKRYAEWIGQELNADLLTIKEAKKKKENFYHDYDTIIYGGWCMGGKFVNAEWFLEKANGWKEKKLAVYGVGATPDDAPEIKEIVDSIVNEEQKKYVKAFYCPGGLDYSKMNFLTKNVMKMYAHTLNKKENLSASEKEKAQALLTSFDLSDKKFIQPIIAFVKG